MRKVIIGQNVPDDYNPSKYILFGYLKGDEEQYIDDVYILQKKHTIEKDELIKLNRISVDYATVNACKVAEYLNSHTGQNLPVKFWEYLINPWWIILIQNVLEKERIIDRFISEYGGEHLLLELHSDKSCIFSYETVSSFFSNGFFSDELNYWLISQIFISRNSKNWDIAKINTVQEIIVHSESGSLKQRLLNIISLLEYKFFPNIVGIESFTIYQKWKLGKILSKIPGNNIVERENMDDKSCEYSFKADFDSIWKQIIPKEFFSIKASPVKDSGAILVNSNILFDTKLKKNVAAKLIGGSALLSVQHGGHNYGSGLIGGFLINDYLLPDYFIKWGRYKNPNIKARQLVLPSIELSKIKGATKKNLSGKILWIGAHMLVKFYRFDSNFQISQSEIYRNNKIEVLKKISEMPVYKDKLVYRPYFTHKNGLRDGDFIKSLFPKIEIKVGKLQMGEIKHLDLLILDHPGTSLNFAYTLNVPTICYWDKSLFLFTPEAEELFEEMSALKLHHSKGSELLDFLESVKDINFWWADDKIQRFIKKFNDKYSWSSKRTYEQWQKKISEIA